MENENVNKYCYLF